MLCHGGNLFDSRKGEVGFFREKELGDLGEPMIHGADPDYRYS